jgi:uncharacterized protein
MERASISGGYMGHYDELDEEIDREMGWHRGDKAGKDSPRRRPDYWQALLRTAKATSSPLWRVVAKGARGVGKVAFFPIISPLSFSRRFNVHGEMILVKRSLLWRLFDGVLMRLLLTPVILAVFLFGVVYANTHPRAVQALATPDSFGVYYKRVNLVTLDNQRLTVWYIPPLSAAQVALDPEGALLQKWPGVVVAHGLGASHDQYLPLAQALHSAGFAVLMLDMRGQGESAAAVVTYGLRESMDVLAGVKYLRELQDVDETKVCVVGHDMGAMAALQAAALDSSITTVVADGLWLNFEDRTREIFARSSTDLSGGWLPTQWLAPLYTFTFEITVRDRLSQLDPDTVVRGLHKQPVLFVARVGREYAPVRAVMTLATNSGGRHEVHVDNPNASGETERRTVEFLTQMTGWKGPKYQGTEEVRELLRNQVKGK